MYSGLVQLRIVLRWKRQITLVAVIGKSVRIVHCFYVVSHMGLSIVTKLVTKSTVVLFDPIK